MLNFIILKPYISIPGKINIYWLLFFNRHFSGYFFHFSWTSSTNKRFGILSGKNVLNLKLIKENRRLSGVEFFYSGTGIFIQPFYFQVMQVSIYDTQ